MRTRRKKPPITVGPELPAKPPIDLAEERHRLNVEMYGKHYRAEQVLADLDDPVLFEKFRQATQSGMPPVDLDTIPTYKRPAVIDEACDDWNRLTGGGPCSICGTIKPRRGYDSTNTQPEEPKFHVFHGNLRACAWCLEYLNAHGGVTGGQDELREAVGNALMATKGLPSAGQSYRYAGHFGGDYLVPFAHQVPDTGDGTPWSHITSSSRLLDRLRSKAFAVVHLSNFITQPNHLSVVRVAGITSVAWDPSDLPRHETKFIPVSRRGRLLAEEGQKSMERLRANKAREEQNRQRRLANLRTRDEQMAQVPDEEREDLLNRWSVYEGLGQPRGNRDWQRHVPGRN